MSPMCPENQPELCKRRDWPADTAAASSQRGGRTAAARTI
jgi:hypothetical protein